MWRNTVLLIVMTIALFVVGARAAGAAESGATFDGGICWEADGAEGVTRIDGECVTPVDYDRMFSFENLSQVVSLSDPSLSVAAVYNITYTLPAGSVRERAFQGSPEPSFVEYVALLHGRPVL